ncbi:MAG: preprotein translocase subunit SecE [Clostridia bacterium]|nr:preprotein translocase subunit SecE [Clostridia bacterium]
MADKKPGFFTRLANGVKGVRAELRRVIWPTKDKLKQISVVCLAIILFFAIYLTVIGSGAKWVLEKVGFYERVEATTTAVAVPDISGAETTAETTAAES